MKLNELRESLKDYARDIRLNLSSVLTVEGAPGLTPPQMFGIALACAFVTKNPHLTEAIQSEAGDALTKEDVEAAKAAATIMAMNNVYYRFLHLAEDGEYLTMPAKLRMNVIGKPGILKSDFELFCLAVSAIAGCGTCVKAHIAEIRKAGLSNEAVQSAIRIASTVNAAAQALAIG